MEFRPLGVQASGVVPRGSGGLALRPRLNSKTQSSGGMWDLPDQASNLAARIGRQIPYH